MMSDRASMTEGGHGGAVLLGDSPALTQAWTGVRIAAAADLTEVRAYAALNETARIARALSAQVSFLAGHHQGALELRYVHDSPAGETKAFLLTRVAGSDEKAAQAAADAAVRRLLTCVDHVLCVPLSAQELLAALQPFPVHPQGAVEVRKRVLLDRPNRPDAGVQWYFAVEPFTTTPRDWAPVLNRLVAGGQDVAVGVAIEPVRYGPPLTSAAAHVATAYARLARDGEYSRGGLYGGKVKLTPDAFAVDAEKTFSDAARRYGGATFALRISVWSPQPLSDALPDEIGATVSRTDRNDGQSHLTSAGNVGAAYNLVRPRHDELLAFQANVTDLSFTRWGRHHAFASGLAPAALEPLCWVVDAAEAAAAFRLPLAVHGHLPGFPVRVADPMMVSDYRPSGPAIQLGVQPGSTSGQPAAVEVAELNTHALIIGTTGSGKTNSTLSLVRSLWADHKVPFLVLEPVNSDRDDYRWLATLPGFEDLLVLTVGDESVAPLRLNPFEVPAGVQVSTHAGNLRACFDAAFGLWDPLPALYARALRLTYSRAGFEPSYVAHHGDVGEWPTLRDFLKAITEVAEGLDYEGEIRSNILAASRLRAESLVEGPCGSTLSATRSFPIHALLDRPVVIELRAVGDDKKEQSLISAMLLMMMTEYYKANRTSSKLAHVTVIEEAHRLLGKPAPTSGDTKEGNAAAKAAETFANTLAENRKYGEGLIIVEQDPSKLVADAYKNTNLKIMHQLPAEGDRRLVGETMHMADDQRAHASVLGKMRAYVFHAGMDRPALVRVPDVRAADAQARGLALAPMAEQSELKDRFASFVASTPGCSEALRPVGECGVCLQNCMLREVARGCATKAHVEAFADLLESYEETVDRETWWQDLRALLRTAGAPFAPRRVRDEKHWLLAVMLELHAEAFQGSPADWVVLVNERL